MLDGAVRAVQRHRHRHTHTPPQQHYAPDHGVEVPAGGEGELRPGAGLEVAHLEGAVHEQQVRVGHLVLPGGEGGHLLGGLEGLHQHVDPRLGLLRLVGVELIDGRRGEHELRQERWWSFNTHKDW